MTDRALTVLVHGASKVGKSSLSVTAPYPRLYLDVESASRFLPINRKVWDPFTEPIPQPDGTWDTVVVYTRDYATMEQVYRRIDEEDHQFKSLIIDSISELQIRLRESIAGRGQMQMQQWGELLTAFAGLLRDLRDLTMHPRNPLEALVLTAMTEEKDGFYRPYLQGAVKTQAPYLYDIIGYLFVDQVASSDPTQPPQQIRRMLTRRHQQFEAGERVQGRIPEWVDNPSIEEMLNQVFPQPQAVPPAPETTTTEEDSQ